MIKSDSDENEEDIDEGWVDDNKLARHYLFSRGNNSSKQVQEMRRRFRIRIKEIFETNVEGRKIGQSFRRLLLGV